MYEEEGGTREREEDELENELASGKMSMYTGVRLSEGLCRLEDGIAVYSAEDMEPVDEEADEASLPEESTDI